MEKYFLLALILFFCFLPLVLVFSKKIIKKKLFFVFMVFSSLQPLSTIFVPAIFSPDIFDGSLIYYLYLIAAYYFVVFFVYSTFLMIVPSFGLYSFEITRKKSHLKKYIIIFIILFFSILVVHSNGVFLYNSRYGYQHFRAGVGFIWVFYITSVSLLFYLMCIKREINFKKILLFIFLMYLTGSKKLILDVFLKSILVFIWSNKRIKKWQIILASFLLVILMLKLFDQFGASQGFLTRVSSYFEFMRLASMVFNDYQLGGLTHTHGQIALTSFWNYIPRAMYPDKPYAYGPVMLVEMYFPGLAQTGHTPSFGMLTADFVDFSWLAPFTAVFLNLGLLAQIFTLMVVVTNSKISKRWVIGSLLFVLSPGFGFHLPILFSIILAFYVFPGLFKYSRNNCEK